MSDILDERIEGGIAILRMIRSEARNSLSLAMLDALSSAFERLGSDVGVRVIILAGSGSVFCAGHDLKEMTSARLDADGGRGFFEVAMKKCSRLMQDIVVCPKPVIAAVEGIATAAGCQLVASCDLAIATRASRFSTPGVHIGLFCSTPMVAVSRNISRKRVMEMLLLGEMIDADVALDWGLVNRVVDSDAVGAARVMGEVIASKSSVVVKTGIEAFYRQSDMTLADAYAYASGVMVENMLGSAAEEGISAFIEKRDPSWSED